MKKTLLIAGLGKTKLNVLPILSVEKIITANTCMNKRMISYVKTYDEMDKKFKTYKQSIPNNQLKMSGKPMRRK